MRKLLLLLAFVGIAVSCKKTVEGESKNWEYNLKSANELMASYPQYKEAIQKQVEEAKGKMESAKKVSSEEERIKAMAEANSSMTNGLVGEIQTYERTKNDLESQIRTLGQKPQTERDENKADRAIDDAKDSKRRAEKLVNGESTADIAEAQTRFKRATSELQTSLDFVKDIADRIDRKNAKRDEQKAQNNGGGGSNDGGSNNAAKVEEKPEDKMVKCEYCSNTVKFGNGKCSGCGAQLKLN